MYNKYIKTLNIPAFRRYMSTRGEVPFHSFKECMFTKGGKHDLRKFDETKIVLLGVKRVGGFQGMNQIRSVSESFIQSFDKVVSLLEVV